MPGGRKPYEKGYRFECRVRKALELLNFKVERKHKSAFPDLIAMPHETDTDSYVSLVLRGMKPETNLIIECKVGKHIRAGEREKFRQYDGYGRLLIAYPMPDPLHKQRKHVVFCDLDYKEVARLHV